MPNGFSFDVGTVLGIGAPNAEPLPEAVEGEIVLRLSEGISLIGLRDSDISDVSRNVYVGWSVLRTS